jgi:hypothetical protein
MREIFETINEYKWTTFFVFLMVLSIANALFNKNK